MKQRQHITGEMGTTKFSFNKKLLSVFLFLLLLPSRAFAVTPALCWQGPSVPRLPLRSPPAPHRRAFPMLPTFLPGSKPLRAPTYLGPWRPAGAQQVEGRHGEQAQARAPVCALTKHSGQGLARPRVKMGRRHTQRCLWGG